MNASRKSDRYYMNSREDLIGLIPSEAMCILDVGCGVGNLGAAFKKARGNSAKVTGIEIDPGSAEKAKKVLDLVILGNVEQIPSPSPKGSLDSIVYGDVLEHLIDPWSMVRTHSELLKPGGTIVASIPNIAHYRTMKMLRKLEWEYKESGIMDETHLRFFTIKSIRRMFEKAGFEVTYVGHIISASKVKKFLNRLLFNRLIDILTEQYLIVAKKR